MSFAKVYSAQNSFLQAHIVDVEVDLSRGLHSFLLVGLPDKAVEEARDRISAAIKNSGFTSPKQKNQKTIVSLAPADIKKEGPHFDVAIAVAYLKAADEILFDAERRIFLGELSLDGKIRPINGTLSLVLAAAQAGYKEAYVPAINAEEASLVNSIVVYGIHNLRELIGHLCQTKILTPYVRKSPRIKTGERTDIAAKTDIDINFSDIHGQYIPKRVLEIAAAGRHNVMLYGPPGSGKTMLAKAFRHILPPLTYEETVEVTAIHSAMGILNGSFLTHPPMRSPHHTSSPSAIIGGANSLRAGEITLAHKGVLFLDEFPEFDRRVIESLRQPLQEKTICISRAKGTVIFPADFILIAAMNPCPCGNYGSAEKICACSMLELRSYRKKISDPIAERIDLWIKVDNQKISDSFSSSSNETEEVLTRVSAARAKQRKRFEHSGTNAQTNARTNAEMNNRDCAKFIQFSKQIKILLTKATNQLSLSLRSYYRTIKVAQTIADLDTITSAEGRDSNTADNEIKEKHLLEALQYRPRLDE